GGSLCIIAAASIRLYPAAAAMPSAWRCPDVAAAVAALERVCEHRLAPGRARIQAGPDGATLGMAWEGLQSAAIERDRAARILRETCLPAPEVPPNFVREPSQGHPVEVDARWASLRSWSSHGDLQLFGLHAGGAFAVLSLPEAGGAEQGAALARAAGARVLARPRSAPASLPASGPIWLCGSRPRGTARPAISPPCGRVCRNREEKRCCSRAVRPWHRVAGRSARRSSWRRSWACRFASLQRAP